MVWQLMVSGLVRWGLDAWQGVQSFLDSKMATK
jgi:hypothetical protein